jgi:hypothetical protein
MDDNRWSVRNVADDARAMIEDVHEETGIPMGRLVAEAIRVWYDSLPEEETHPLAGSSLAALLSD